jgi:hypothetical protein
MKIVKAIPPYIYKGASNFKYYPCEAWEKIGGKVSRNFYPPQFLHSLIYRITLPSVFIKSKREVRLRFVSGYSIQFDTFPDYAFYEVIPVIWDCWPKQVESVAAFFRKHQVKTAIFTSSQTADIFRRLFPQMNVLTITEGIKIDLYSPGNVLSDRKIDILEIGRKDGNFFKTPLPEGINHVKTGNFARTFQSDEEFRAALADTKVTVTVPRCDVNPETAGNIETLTQRYWECMLSRIVMVGRAPKELIDLIGYNPVIDWDGNDASPLVSDILGNIGKYQDLVNRNYETAKEMASWEMRMKDIMIYLKNKGYSV